MTTSLRLGFIALLTGLLLSCGGGGGGGGGGSFGVTAPVGSGAGTAAGGESIPSGAASVGSGGTSDGAGGGAGSAGGSDGPGAGVSASAGGDDGSGVGSGGTGVSTAAATGVGAVDGAGSIFVNGVRYDTTGAVVDLQDATELRLGMSAKVTGPVSADFTTGSAVRIESAADVRGPLTVPDLGQGRFQVLGTTIVTDSATVWADSTGLGAIVPGTTVQVWGLPETPGLLRATRVEQQPLLAGPILTGTVQNLDSATRTFRLGALVIAYGGAIVSDGLGGTSLSNGTFVRVRADVVLQPGRLTAARIDRWYPVPLAEGSTLQLAGVITGYTGLASLRVLGIPV
ncbi:MAG: hypothetical protein KJ832_22810, partial [Gammaproteobacteria bacterium]|nr:hypothetical protein [Gammaproteobacteria bacterium]